MYSSYKVSLASLTLYLVFVPVRVWGTAIECSYSPRILERNNAISMSISGQMESFMHSVTAVGRPDENMLIIFYCPCIPGVPE